MTYLLTCNCDGTDLPGMSVVSQTALVATTGSVIWMAVPIWPDTLGSVDRQQAEVVVAAIREDCPFGLLGKDIVPA